jgi:hypothetical protein
MKNARARLALLSVLAFSAIAAAVPAAADAYVSYYDCYLKPSNVWCDGRANGSFDQIDDYDYNEGWYPGTWDGTVTACQRLYKTSDGSVLGGSNCAANYTAYDYGTVTCVCYEANVKQISGGDHSIHGMADSEY